MLEWVLFELMCLTKYKTFASFRYDREFREKAVRAYVFGVPTAVR